MTIRTTRGRTALGVLFIASGLFALAALGSGLAAELAAALGGRLAGVLGSGGADPARFGDHAARSIGSLLLVVVAALLSGIARRTTVRVLRHHGAAANLVALGARITQTAVFVGGALGAVTLLWDGALGYIGASLGVIGLVVGLSLQDILRNVFSGIYVLAERTFSIGDEVDIPGAFSGARIERIAFRTTQLRAADGRRIVLPNSTLMTATILSGAEAHRALAEVRVAGTAAAHALAAARAALPPQEGEPAAEVSLTEVRPDGVTLEVAYWAADPRAAFADVAAAIQSALPEATVTLRR